LIAAGLRPAICGHTDLYPRELLAGYRDALEQPGGLERLLARWPADALLLDHRRLEGSELLSAALARLTLVYLDPRDAIFVRPGLRPPLDLDTADLERDLRDPVRDRLALASFLI